MQQQAVNLYLASLKSKRNKEQYQFHCDRYIQKAPTTETDPEKLENHIMAYLTQMSEDGLSYSYRNIALAAIKHYYITQHRRIVLNWDFISKILGEQTTDNELRGYTREEIRKMLNVSDVPHRALILTLVSTGM